MAHDVHLHVCFPCDTNEIIACIAEKHLGMIDREIYCEASWFLEDLSKRTGSNRGPKGGLSLWGIVGNHTDEDSFVSVLIPFWSEILSSNGDGTPLDHEHILVFSEHEQTEKTKAHEIYLDGETLIIKKHDCPFNFGQF
jgi:hypothetical protein